MDKASFQDAVDTALRELPQWVVDKIDNLNIAIKERPSVEQDPHGHGLLGLYEGISLLERSGDYFGAMPDLITIFRQPHIALGLPDDQLRVEIRKTVLHEVAHHLGIDDERLHELGWD